MGNAAAVNGADRVFSLLSVCRSAWRDYKARNLSAHDASGGERPPSRIALHTLCEGTIGPFASIIASMKSVIRRTVSSSMALQTHRLATVAESPSAPRSPHLGSY